MPIAFRCSSCAQILTVADNLAGGRGKCPKCGAVIRIPAAKEPVAEAPAEPTPRKSLLSQPTIMAESPLPARRRAAAVREDDEGDTPEEPVAPRRSARKNKKGKTSPAVFYSLIGGGCAGLLLLCSGAGALAWWFFFSASIDDDLKYMPTSCQAVVSIRSEQMMQSQVFGELRREIPDFDKNMKSDMHKEIGLSVDDIEQAVIGAGPTSKDTIIVLRTKKAVEASDLRAKIKNGKYTETKVGKYVMQESKNTTNPTFCVVDKKRIIYGETDAVRSVLLRDRKPEFSKNMQAALKQVDFGQTIALAVDVQSNRSKAGDALGMFGAKNDALSTLEKTDALTAQVRFGSDIRLEITLLCQNAASANDVKKLIDGFLVMARNNKQAPKELNDLLDVNLKVDGSKVVGNKTFKVGPMIKLYKEKNGKR